LVVDDVVVGRLERQLGSVDGAAAAVALVSSDSEVEGVFGGVRAEPAALRARVRPRGEHGLRCGSIGAFDDEGVVSDGVAVHWLPFWSVEVLSRKSPSRSSWRSQAA